MSAAVRDRLRSLFLDPAAAPAARPATQVAERAVPAAVAVLCPPELAAAAGAAVALAVAGRGGAPCAVVCRWTGEDADLAEAGVAMAAGAARRMAARLGARGLAAAARGRIVTVGLPGDGVGARAAAERAAAAAGDVPVVLVVAGPRPAALDALLAAQDRLVVVPGADACAGLEDVAVREAARLGRATGVLRLPGSPSARAAVACGLALSPLLRAAGARALDGHDA